MVMPPICFKSTYEPESTDPWKDGKIFENVKEWMSSIGKTVITFIPAEELLEGGSKQYRDWQIPNTLLSNANQGQKLITNDQENNESNHTELNEISNLECGCNKQLKILSTNISQYSSLVNSNIDSLEDHSPYGLGSSNNIVMESLVSVENVLF